LNPETRARLNAINQRFYQERADEFDRTRERPWPGWEDLFDRYEHHIAKPPRILDIGCGNGRFARFVHDRTRWSFSYVGVDASALALEHARRRLAHLSDVLLLEHDVLAEPAPVPESLDAREFDLIVLFGVIHHVPGASARSALLDALSHRLAEGGMIAYSVWRFDRFERFRRKLVPWNAFREETGVVIDADELEPGDSIMTWGEPSPAYRYCHATSDDEAARIVAELPLTPLPEFLGDGDKNGYYALLRQTPEAKRA